MSAETVKNIKFGDKVIKTDANGDAGDIVGTRIAVGSVEASDISADVIGTNDLEATEHLYFWFNGTKYLIGMGEYGIKAFPQ